MIDRVYDGIEYWWRNGFPVSSDGTGSPFATLEGEIFAIEIAGDSEIDCVYIQDPAWANTLDATTFSGPEISSDVSGSAPWRNGVWQKVTPMHPYVGRLFQPTIREAYRAATYGAKVSLRLWRKPDVSQVRPRLRWPLFARSGDVHVDTLVVPIHGRHVVSVWAQNYSDPSVTVTLNMDLLSFIELSIQLSTRVSGSILGAGGQSFDPFAMLAANRPKGAHFLLLSAADRIRVMVECRDTFGGGGAAY